MKKLLIANLVLSLILLVAVLVLFLETDFFAYKPTTRYVTTSSLNQALQALNKRYVSVDSNEVNFDTIVCKQLYVAPEHKKAFGYLGSSIDGEVSLKLLDANWRVKTMLISGDLGPSLMMYDSHGVVRSMVKVFDIPAFTMFDANGSMRSAMAVTENGAMLRLCDSNSNRSTSIGCEVTTNKNGTKLISPESSIRFTDGDGKVIWEAP